MSEKSSFRVFGIFFLLVALLTDVCFAQTYPSVAADAHAKVEPATTATVVQAVLAAASSAVGLNATLTTSAEVRAVSTSGGPDDDDLALIFQSDSANTPFETNLRASTLDEAGTRDLGPNYGWRVDNPHRGSALIEVKTPLTSTRWTANQRAAVAYARRDGTPEFRKNNTTAASSMAVFHMAGTVAATFTIQEQDSLVSKQGTFLGVGTPNGDEEIVFTSYGAALWSVSSFFLLENEGGTVTVFPPATSIELFHDFVQMENSPRYRRNLVDQVAKPGLAKTLLQEELDGFNDSRNSAAGTTPLTDANTVDFTVGGAVLNMAIATLDRGELSDREVVENYLLSDAITLSAPTSAQAGYVPEPVFFSLIGGGQPAPTGSQFQEDGGMDSFYAGLLEDSELLPEDSVGLLVETRVKLVDAMNRAAVEPSHPLYGTINVKLLAGDPLALTLFIQQLITLTDTSQENTTNDCVFGSAELEEVYVALGGVSLSDSERAVLRELETGVPTVNSNPELEPKVPDCVTEIAESVALSSFSPAAKAAPECGNSDLGLTVCATPGLPLLGGDHVALSITLGNGIPLQDPTNSYQFGFVFDTDGRSGNNWVPLPQFANDYFQGTDRWYAVEYTPSTGWRLNVTSVTNDQTLEPYTSGARAIIKGNTITLIIAKSELGSKAKYRLTAFRHSGDFGQNPPFDWSADYHPRLDEPLATLAPAKRAFFGCGTKTGLGNGYAADFLILLALLAMLGVCAVVGRKPQAQL